MLESSKWNLFRKLIFYYTTLLINVYAVKNQIMAWRYSILAIFLLFVNVKYVFGKSERNIMPSFVKKEKDVLPKESIEHNKMSGDYMMEFLNSMKASGNDLKSSEESPIETSKVQ